MKVLANLFYTEDHDWVKVEGDTAYIGITDFAQHALGDIVFVELPEVDSEFEQGDTYGVIESVKAAADSHIAVSGKVLEVNEAVSDDPSLLNQDAYDNWIMKVELTNKSELDNLMGSEEYEEFCSKEE